LALDRTPFNLICFWRLFKINVRHVINDVVGAKNEDQREAQKVAGPCA